MTSSPAEAFDQPLGLPLEQNVLEEVSHAILSFDPIRREDIWPIATQLSAPTARQRLGNGLALHI
jgi:hypothetical protein